MVVLIVVSLGVDFLLLTPYVCFHILSKVWVTELPPIGKIAAHSACYIFSE